MAVPADGAERACLTELNVPIMSDIKALSEVEEVDSGRCSDRRPSERLSDGCQDDQDDLTVDTLPSGRAADAL